MNSVSTRKRQVRIEAEEKDAFGQTRYIVQCLGPDGNLQQLNVMHDDLYAGSWLYQFGGETTSAVRLGTALYSEWAAKKGR